MMCVCPPNVLVLLLLYFVAINNRICQRATKTECAKISLNQSHSSAEAKWGSDDTNEHVFTRVASELLLHTFIQSDLVMSKWSKEESLA